jgi:hypothetical protein
LYRFLDKQEGKPPFLAISKKGRALEEWRGSISCLNDAT